jgi:voltage-gated potassium channel
VQKQKPVNSSSPYKEKIYTVIFEAETPAGRIFDVFLLVTIILSIFVVFLESIQDVRGMFGAELYYLEWVFTLLFTVEYLFRLYSVRKPLKYALSFFGIVDLLAIIPTYLSLFVVGTQYFLVIRILRLLRVFRIFRLTHFVREGLVLGSALRASRPKIIVFLMTVLSIITIVGALMYVVEGPENGYNSIPLSIYWAIVTLTTVGYGDISPQTPLGQFLASLVMIIGYSIIAIPTGIVSVEIAEASKRQVNSETCPNCLKTGHDSDARFCKYCSSKL